MTQVTSAPACKQALPLPSLEVLDELLHYDPETGVIRWRKTMRRGSVPAGDIAGCVAHKGYRLIGVGGRRYLAHRLAFKLHHRRDPLGQVDHRDVDTSNNRADNLRDSSHSENMWNAGRRTDNASGVKGVFWNKQKMKWQGVVMLNLKRYHVGYFQSLKEADTAIRATRERLHNEFSRHG